MSDKTPCTITLGNGDVLKCSDFWYDDKGSSCVETEDGKQINFTNPVVTGYKHNIESSDAVQVQECTFVGRVI